MTGAPQQRARDWWQSTLNGSRPVGLPWASALGFIRIATHRRIWPKPMAVNDAVRYVRTWIDHPRVRIVTPGERHAEILFGLLSRLGAAGNLTSDAHLAELGARPVASTQSMRSAHRR